MKPVTTMKPRKKRERKPATRPLAASPLSVDRSAKERLDVAAKAAGISIEALADLMVESGAITLPPSETITRPYTLKDMGTKLWAGLQEIPIANRKVWFADLTQKQRDALVTTLKHEGFQSEVIARELGLQISEVIDTWNRYCDDLGSQVVGLRLNTIAGQLAIQAERVQAMALQSDDYKTFWTVSKDFVGILQNLGIVDRAIHKVDHHHTVKFDDQRKAEIDALVSLEMKKKRHSEDLRIIDAEVVDTVPKLTDDYDVTIHDDDEEMDQELP
jgi:hypothetical protein